MPKETVVHNSAIDQYVHSDKKRLNNPEVGLVNPDKEETGKKTYQFDPHIDPELQWAGKAERTSFEVPTVSLHVHERIDPKTILESVKKEIREEQPSFSFGEKKPLRQAVEFYKHENRWSNRFVSGDSLLVMNSLLEKEGMGGKVQTIYFDPPYGIKYGSNFQPFVNKRDVKDGKDEDLTAEPEMIKAFRDTWELGIHSYLSYLRDRLFLAKDLLTESGSIFVQISDENVHRVRLIMDEVFGSENQISTISWKKATPISKTIRNAFNYLLWYSKEIDKVKINKLYSERSGIEGTTEDPKKLALWGDFKNGDTRTLSTEEKRNIFSTRINAEVFRVDKIIERGDDINRKFELNFQGKKFNTDKGYHWRGDGQQLQRLLNVDRVVKTKEGFGFKFYIKDYPIIEITNFWEDTAGNISDMIYAVQTNEKIIQRCILMTSDPGELVFDPTCLRRGSLVWVGGFSSPLNNPTQFYSTVDSPRVRGELFCGDYYTGDSTRLRGDIGGRGVSHENISHDEPVLLSQNLWIPVESLIPGMQVLSHDGKLHRIIRTITREYSGLMVGINHNKTSSTLWVTGDHRILVKRKKPYFGGDSSWKHIPYHHFQYAKNLRKKNTRAERFVWKYLKETFPDIKFRRQHPIGPFIVDFYSRELHLVLELDGAHHFTQEGMEYDRKRDEYLESCGVKVCRLENNIALKYPHEIDKIVNDIVDNIVDENRKWVRADELNIGDTIYFGENLEEIQVISLDYDETSETVFDIEVEDAHSFLTESCMVHNCGSGTTAYVAEQWGRRWITCDTSRVAINLAKQRLMTASFDYYVLEDEKKGVSGNFQYKTVPHITLKSIANNGEIDVIHEKWEKVLQPLREEINQLAETKYEEWEIPRTVESGKWKKTSEKSVVGAGHVQLLLAKYWDKKIQRQKEIDDSISRHADQETLVDQPITDRKKARVTGPFTVEAVPAPIVKSIGEAIEGNKSDTADNSIVRSGATLKQSEWRSELARVGVRAKKGSKIEFSYLEVLSGTRHLHAVGETKEKNPKRVVVSFGPEFAPYDKTLVELAIREAEKLRPRADMILFCAFQFEEEAAKDIEETNWEGVTLLKVQMNTDLFTEDLKKKRATNDSFWLIGQPDVALREIKKGEHKGKYQVEVLGFDYYDPKTNEVKSGGKGEIAMWMLDSDYDGRSIFPKQVFLPMSGDKDGWSKLAKNLKAEIDEDLIEEFRSTISLPFTPGKQVAIKIVDNRGIESIRVFQV